MDAVQRDLVLKVVHLILVVVVIFIHILIAWSCLLIDDLLGATLSDDRLCRVCLLDHGLEVFTVIKFDGIDFLEI